MGVSEEEDGHHYFPWGSWSVCICVCHMCCTQESSKYKRSESPILNKEAIPQHYICFQVILTRAEEMFLPSFLSLSMLALLQLGATQEFVLTRNQLREDVQVAITAALNSSDSLLNFDSNNSCTCNTVVERQANIMTQLHLLRVPGSTPSRPAASCKEIKELNPTAPSGYYWLKGTGGSSYHMYCDMSRSCGGITGGWMRVTKINMTNSSHTCPEGLKLLTTPKRLCAMNIDGGGCSSATFDLHGLRYTHVCGKIIGYQQKTPDAFYHYYNNRGLTIDDTYVDGISLTHGRNPRKHIWTFAAAVQEAVSSSGNRYICPCTNTNNTVSIPIPPYVGSDYFCDTASENDFQFRFYPNDPLWDGQGCGRLNTCCSFNNPPWFMKELPSPTRESIEMRLCANQARTDEDIPFESTELYVQ